MSRAPGSETGRNEELRAVDRCSQLTCANRQAQAALHRQKPPCAKVLAPYSNSKRQLKVSGTRFAVTCIKYTWSWFCSESQVGFLGLDSLSCKPASQLLLCIADSVQTERREPVADVTKLRLASDVHVSLENFSFRSEHRELGAGSPE